MGNRIPKEANFRSFQGKNLKARISRVIDTDTVEVITKLNFFEPYYKLTVRLEGLDAPEMKPHRKNFETEADRLLHKKAAEHATFLVRNRILPVGKIVHIKFGGTEKFGRQLGTFYIKHGVLCLSSSLNVNNMLISEGLALFYDGKQKKEFSNEQLRKILSIQ